jgi:2-dehydropantoate 2-reductase
LVPVSGAATFLIFSGNWDGIAAYDALLPRERYLLGYPDAGGTIRDEVYWTNIGPEVHLGLLEGQSAEKLEQVKATFARANLKPDMQSNILHWLWIHNAGVIGIAAAFAKYKTIKGYLNDKPLVNQSLRATKELYALCARRGVNLKQFPEIRYMSWPQWLVTLLLRLNFSRNESMQRYTAHAASDGSLQETKYFYGKAMRTAAELSFEMPDLKAAGAYLQPRG